MENFIKYSIVFGPTILFALIVLVRMLIGYVTGARKQVIFFVHSLGAFIICLIVYLVILKNERILDQVDGFILNIINKFMGENGLQNALGVSESCKTIRQIFVEYIPSQMDLTAGLELILRDNGAYLLTLVNVSFHLVLAFILYFVYLLLEGIMYIIYLIFYSERKHKNKKNARYEDGIEERPYFKHKKYGATIGLCRGLIRGLIFMAFIGTMFFITSGVGNKNRAKYKTNDEKVDLGLTIYKEIGNYGEYGIFKVLNMCKDKEDVPYYLYAVDLLYQGGLKDDNREINTDIHLIEELNAYVEFSSDTFDLLMKYGSDKLTPIILGKYEGNPMDVILEIMANSSFQAEFKILINNFDAQTYFINFALSLVDSIANYIDQVDFMQDLSSDAIDVLSIAFKRGYLSDTIPYERTLKYQGRNVELGYIKPSSLLNSNDAKTVLFAILEIIDLNQIYKNDSDFGLKTVEIITKYIKDLSIIDTSRCDELNPVLKRLYAFVDSKYLSTPINTTNELKQQRMTNIIYIDKDYDSIDWVSELNLLVDSVEDILVLFNDVYKNTKDAFSATLAIFDEKSLNYKRNLRIYHDIVNKLSYSKMLGEAASSIIVTDTIQRYISENIASSFTIPTDIKYANEVVDGETYYGEVYYFLSGIEKLCVNDQNINIFDEFKNATDMTDVEAFDLIERLSSVLASPDGDSTYASKLLKSKIIHALLSAYIIDNGHVTDEFEIYIDNSIISNNLISYDELTLFFNVAPDTLKEVRKFVIPEEESSEADETKEIIDLLQSETGKKALDSKIFEGTLSGVMANKFASDELIILPPSFSDRTKHIGWVSSNSEDSEIKKLILALTESGFDLNGVIEGDTSSVTESIKNLDSEKTDMLLNSNILYYSISKYLINNADTLSSDMPIIIPYVVIINYNDIVRIEKNTLHVFLSNASTFLKDDIDSLSLMKDLNAKEEILNNGIYSATLAYSMAHEANPDIPGDKEGIIHNAISGTLPIPEHIKSYASKEKLKEEFTSINPWKYEAKNLIRGIDKLINIDELESFDEIDGNRVKDSIISVSDKDLTVIYSSNVLAYKISLEVFNAIDLSDELEHVDLAYQAGTKTYLYDEIRSLVDLFRKTQKPSFDEALENISVLKISDVTNNVSDSYLLTKTITEKLRGNITILKNDYIQNYETFRPDALSIFLSGVLLMANDVNMTIKDANDIKFENMHMPTTEDIEVISKSQSLMATVTENISFTIEGDSTIKPKMLYKPEYCSVKLDINGYDCAVISRMELEKVILYLDGFNDNINVDNLINQLISGTNVDSNYPNLLRMIVNDYLINVCKAYSDAHEDELSTYIRNLLAIITNTKQNIVHLIDSTVSNDYYANDTQILGLVYCYKQING